MRTVPSLSVVSTLYRSSGTVDEFVSRSVAAAQVLVGQDFEIVLVDDGSPDDSWSKAMELTTEFPQLRVIQLSRNFGHHAALLEGLRQSSGELVFLIDSDLEEQPEWLWDFHETLIAETADSVYGYQRARKGGRFERLSGAIYWRVFRTLTAIDVPPSIVTCRLMRRDYVNAVLQYPETQLSLVGIFALAGFQQVALPVCKGHKGSSTYSSRMKIWHFVNSITSFSSRPLEFIFISGISITTIGFLLVGYLIAAALIWNTPPTGWTSVMASLWVIGGLLLLSLGTVAVYLDKVFLEVKSRPRVLTRKTYPK